MTQERTKVLYRLRCIIPWWIGFDLGSESKLGAMDRIVSDRAVKRLCSSSQRGERKKQVIGR